MRVSWLKTSPCMRSSWPACHNAQEISISAVGLTSPQQPCPPVLFMTEIPGQKLKNTLEVVTLDLHFSEDHFSNTVSRTQNPDTWTNSMR